MAVSAQAIGTGSRTSSGGCPSRQGWLRCSCWAGDAYPTATRGLISRGAPDTASCFKKLRRRSTCRRSISRDSSSDICGIISPEKAMMPSIGMLFSTPLPVAGTRRDGGDDLGSDAGGDIGAALGRGWISATGRQAPLSYLFNPARKPARTFVSRTLGPSRPDCSAGRVSQPARQIDHFGADGPVRLGDMG